MLRSIVARAQSFTTASDRRNSRSSARPNKYESVDSAPLFSLRRSGCNPSAQLPDSGSIIDVCKSFSPKNQPNARKAPSRHSGLPSACAATRHAEIVAAASTGCWSKTSRETFARPKFAVPMGRKHPEGASWRAISQRSDRSPAST